jgi:hypothetical protein
MLTHALPHASLQVGEDLLALWSTAAPRQILPPVWARLSPPLTPPAPDGFLALAVSRHFSLPC